ncbi:MAG: choice-of-anchor D domain-containing protein, partial [Candidatus Nitrosocaldus sp.]
MISYEDTDGDGELDDNVRYSKQTRPFVSYDAAEQRFFVVWQDGRNGSLSLENLDIYGQKVDAEGSLRGNNYPIFTLPSNQYYPTIAYNDITQEFLTVWKDARDADNSTCSSTGGVGTGNKPCGADVYGQLFTLRNPALTLLNMDNTPLTPPLLSNFQNPPGSGSVEVGLFATQSFKIRSTGDVTLRIDSIDPTCGGTQASLDPFSFDGLPTELSAQDGTTLDLVPGAELTLTVRFTPPAGGSYNRCFIIRSDGGNPTVNLSALAVESNITVQPTSWNFGNVYVGSYGEKTFVVKNTGMAVLRITSVTPPSSPFSIINDGCSGQNIAPGNTCNLVVRFTPPSAGPFNSQFSINSNDPDTPTLNVPIQGTGVGAADITVTPLSINFGNIQVGQSSQQTITVKNDGTAVLNITSIIPPLAPFSIVGNNCPASLGIGVSCQITVRFAPTSEGTTSSNLTINSDDPDEGTVVVNLSGTGVILPDIDVTPLLLDFGTVPLYSVNYLTFTVTNVGGGSLTITSVSNPGFPYGIQTDNCSGQSLSAGASCTVTVYFNPTYVGNFYPYYIYVNSNDPDEGTVQVTLKGEAVSSSSAQRLTSTLGNSESPSVAIDSANNIHVVWHDNTPGNYEIYYKKSTDGGNTWSADQRLTYTSGVSNNPMIAIDSANNIHVVWHDNTPGNYEIYYKKSTDGGNTWTWAKRLTYTSGSSNNPAIGVDSSGNIHVVWHDNTPGNYEIYYKKSTDGGNTWTWAKRLTYTSGSSNNPAIGIDSSGNIHVVWHDNTPGNYEIYYKKSTDGGNTWTWAKRLTYTSGSSNNPAIGIDSSGNIHVVWHDNTPGNYEIYYKKSTDGGNTW